MQAANGRQAAQPSPGLTVSAGASLGHGYLTAIAVLALIGIGIGGYLSYTHWAHAEVICTGLRSCEYVQQSAYATIAGLPIAFLGAVLYAVILAGALVSLRRPERAEMATLVVFACAFGGVLYAAYLTYLELFVLHAVCLWCAGSALTTLAIFVLAVLRERAGGRPST